MKSEGGKGVTVSERVMECDARKNEGATGQAIKLMLLGQVLRLYLNFLGYNYNN